MDDPSPSTAPPVNDSRGWLRIQSALSNPVIMKEMRGRMRGRQALLLLTAYLALISLVIGVLYITMESQPSSSFGQPDLRQVVGKAVFGTVVIMELLLVTFIGPALTSGAVTSERERQTFDVLRSTTLTSRSFVLGKLGASLVYLLLLIFAALPIESIAFLLGGVAPEEFIVSSLMLAVTAVFFCTLGMFFSSFMKRTTGATVTSYATIVLSFVLLAVAFFVLTYYTTVSSAGGQSGTSPLIEPFTILAWIFISTNPVLAAIISETILVSQQNLLWASAPLGNQGITLPSPWIPFVLIYLGLTVLMIIVSIRRVDRPDR